MSALMKIHPLPLHRRPLALLGALAAALVALALVPQIASAITITVDDDRVQCPVADYTSLTAAVAAAANGDTVHVCAGTYNVPGGPAPTSGLKIEKNLKIEGAGASKVFVQPTPGSGPMYQTPPNPRDEYGNVITVRRRLIELYEVVISGLTVRAYSSSGTGSETLNTNIPTEAGIAMIDVDVAKISGVRVEGLVPMTKGTSPSPQPGTGVYGPGEPLAAAGQGIIVANTIEDSDNVTTIEGSEVKGFNATGILVDNRLLSGAGQVTNNSHMTAKIVNTKVTGVGGTPPIAQTGVEAWGSGARVQITRSKIAGVGKADGSAAAIALHGVDVGNSVVGGADAEAVNLTGNTYGATNVAYDGSATAATLNATHNFWGTTVSGATPLVSSLVDYEPTLGVAPAEPTLAPLVDTPPTVQWDTVPAAGGEVAPGQTVHLAVVAGDDFGVANVVFRLSGGALGISPQPALNGERVYQIDWAPSSGQGGPNQTLTAIATDSNGQETKLSTTVNVKGKPRLGAAAGTIGGKTGGFALVGKPLTCDGTDVSYPAATITYAWFSGGEEVGTGPTYTPTAADQGQRISCTVTAVNPYGTVSQTGGQVEVAALPEFTVPTEIFGASAPYALVGDELECETEAEGEDDLTLTLAWLRDGAPIPGTAEDPEYTLTAADAAHTVTCSVDATDSAGTVTSAASVAVGAAPSGGTAAIAGDSKVGSTLSCSGGPWTALPAATVGLEWLRNGTPVGSGATYKTTVADVGAQIACRASAANAIGAAAVTSAPIAVTPAPPAIALGGALVKPGGKLATLSCDLGPCTTSAPQTVKVKIGGKTFTAVVMLPASLAGGGSGKVTVELGKAGRKALKKAGKSSRFQLKVTVTGGGAAVTDQISAQLT